MKSVELQYPFKLIILFEFALGFMFFSFSNKSLKVHGHKIFGI